MGHEGRERGCTLKYTRRTALASAGTALLTAGLSHASMSQAEPVARASHKPGRAEFRAKRPKRRRRSAPVSHGLYENCKPSHPEALTRLSEMRAAGITQVLNYWVWEGTDEEILAYADYAANVGIILTWPAGGTDEQIALVRDHPATWGFYVGEEAFTSKQQLEVRAYAQRVKAIAPDSKRLYTGWGATDFLRSSLSPLRDACEVMAIDFYPVGLDQLPAGRSINDTDDYARELIELTDEWGLEPAMVLQAFSWASEPTLAPPGDWQWPTVNQMSRMREMAENEGITQIFWFDYLFIKPLGSTDTTRLDNLAAAIA